MYKNTKKLGTASILRCSIGPFWRAVDKWRVAAVFAGPVIPRRKTQVPARASYDVCLSGFLQGHSSGNFGFIRKMILLV